MALPSRLAQLPTAPISAAGLIAGYGVAVGADSRPLGGAVLAGFGLTCIAVWLQRGDTRTTAKLTAIGLGAFVVSHGLGMLIGAWPAVLVCAAGTAVACERLSDSRWRGTSLARVP